MPTYDYRCVDCGEVSEHFHSIGADYGFTCPYCAGVSGRRLPSAAATTFKMADSSAYKTLHKRKRPVRKPGEG